MIRHSYACAQQKHRQRDLMDVTSEPLLKAVNLSPRAHLSRGLRHRDAGRSETGECSEAGLKLGVLERFDITLKRTRRV